MKYFWYSLIVFLLLMCSCKSKKVATDINVVSKERIESLNTTKQSFVDTSWVQRIFTDNSKLRIVETIKITEYDKESGKPIKETEAKRETTQDSDKVVAEEAQNGVTEASQDSLNHVADVSNMVEAEVAEELIGGQESFGKWFGIIFGCVIGLLVIYLLVKLRVN